MSGDNKALEDIAYSMEKAYSNCEKMDDAVNAVSKHYRDADLDILRAMWMAIDAYVDLNT